MNKFWGQPIVIAAYRAVVGGAVLAGVAYFGSLQSGQPQHVAGIAAGAAFFGYLLLRGGFEGIVDQRSA